MVSWTPLRSAEQLGPLVLFIVLQIRKARAASGSRSYMDTRSIGEQLKDSALVWPVYLPTCPKRARPVQQFAYGCLYSVKLLETHKAGVTSPRLQLESLLVSIASSF